jgi:hypothetical protein
MEKKVEEAVKVREEEEAREQEQDREQVKVREEEAGGQRALVERRRVRVDIASVCHVVNERSTNEGSLVLIKNVRSVAPR